MRFADAFVNVLEQADKKAKEVSEKFAQPSTGEQPDEIEEDIENRVIKEEVRRRANDRLNATEARLQDAIYDSTVRGEEVERLGRSLKGRDAQILALQGEMEAMKQRIQKEASENLRLQEQLCAASEKIGQLQREVSIQNGQVLRTQQLLKYQEEQCSKSMGEFNQYRDIAASSMREKTSEIHALKERLSQAMAGVRVESGVPEELRQALEDLAALRLQLDEVTLDYTQQLDQYRIKCVHAESQIEYWKCTSENVRHSHDSLQAIYEQELSSAADTRQRLTEELHSKSATIASLEQQLRHSASAASGTPPAMRELEARLQSMTTHMLAKQLKLDEIHTERDLLQVQLQAALSRANTAEARVRSVGFLPPSPPGNLVADIAGQLLRALRQTRFFSGSSTIKIAACLYILLLHLWVFFVLSFRH